MTYKLSRLQVTGAGTAGEDVAISDGFNNVFEGAAGVGGLDLTGLLHNIVDMGHSGVGAIGVQFFAQASQGTTYVVLGTQNVAPGIATYTPSAPASHDKDASSTSAQWD